MHKLLWMAGAGAVGTLCRYGMAAAVQRLAGPSFPYGTSAVNILGCFLFGVVWAVAEQRSAIGSELRMIVLTGFMGAFTTFSTFAFETSALMRQGQLLLAAVNVGGQVVLGVLMVIAGMAVARFL